ncbi:MAG: DUF1367 family protein [Odoribacter splanchnicus]|nr:DUF1367 family protein [Odoribacter splanchnicus]
MKLNLLNTVSGLIPLYDADYDEKKKLKIGSIYEVTIRLSRNIDFHRKYFALIQCAWEYQNERTVNHFKNDINVFRKTVEIAAGWCEPVYSIDRKEWLDLPKSIAFDKMDNTEFTDLYDRVKDVLFKYFLKHITCEEFEKNLINF